MLRYLQSAGRKNVQLVKAGADMTRGMAVTYDVANGEADKHTGVGDGLVDVAPTYNGTDLIIRKNDSGAETIKSGAVVAVVNPYPGERYVTNQLTATKLIVGDALTATAGVFGLAGSEAAYKWVYCGVFEDPTPELNPSYIIQRVNAGVAPKQFTVTYDKNTGTGTMTDSLSPYIDGRSVTVKANTFVAPTGKRFVKFNTAANGTGTDYAAGAKFNVAANTVLYAIWEDIPTYTVTYDANTGTGTMTDASSPYQVGSTVTVLDNTFTPPTDKVFDGYSTAADGSGTDYAEGATFTISANVTLYAQWKTA